MSGINQPSINEASIRQIPVHLQNSDSIDLRELFKALWDGKVTIAVVTLAFVASAVIYALTAQEWWSSEGTISQAQPHDVAAYQQQVKQFQSAFDIYQEDGTVLVSKELNDLVDTEVLFSRFIDAFNSSNNKRVFLDSSQEFQAFKAKLNDNDNDDDDATSRLYVDWFGKVKAQLLNKKGINSAYEVSFQAATKDSSFSLLNAYIDIIAKQVQQESLNNLQAIVGGKRDELIQQKRILETQAAYKIMVEIERAKYALDIAKAADVNQPIQINNNEIFSIGFGAKALAAKIKALESVKNLNVVEPRLQQINAKLSMLETLEVDRSIQFKTFRFLDNVEKSLSRDKPKRVLIAVLGALLGGMLGIAIVLVRFAFRSEEETQ
ncbi:Wzz/FepE/Etk N-terminal domain-containing protein [Vibrio pectenicida]|uniref:LPS chain length-determining protein n=1 Tax=Vibrio pectenicida TaxID=62763 RepID=A0A3R9FS29_9VIBR|nr:LPS chain length-determining protein [Vibrio pectenicida]